MLTKIYSAAINGIDAFPVTIETEIWKGAGFTIVGMADTAIRESYERMLSAIRHSGYEFPHYRITINLAPADIKKEGAQYDLPMAVGILACAESIRPVGLESVMLTGELSLDGSVLPVKGVLPIAIKAREMGVKSLIVPEANVTEAAVVNKLDVYGVRNLQEAIAIIEGKSDAEPVKIDTRALFLASQQEFDYDFSEVKGQESVKRAFEISCAGGHNIIMVGPPGAGKSMMAKRLPSIMPPLSMGEALETTKIHSVAGKLSRGSMLMTTRPFRTPHHTVSPVALVGGGVNPMPGEISLAHNGVLFLDEFPEFPRQVLEVLRQPIEDRYITVARAKYTVNYPSSFMLVASMNPCPCGYYGHPTRPCTCTPGAVSKYVNRISGPLLDRIDLQVEIEPVAFDDMADPTPTEPSAEIRKRVMKAREIQQLRYKDEKGIHCNAQMNTRLLKKYAWPDEAGMAKLKERMTKLNMSARAFDRILRVARTIADLESAVEIISEYSDSLSSSSDSRSGSPNSLSSYPNSIQGSSLSIEEASLRPVRVSHIAEAISYRALDRGSYGSTF